MNNESCIQPIELLRQLALNIHGVIDVIDNRNCNDIINLLNEQEAVEPITEHHLFLCPVCKNTLFREQKFCHECGKRIEWKSGEVNE